MRERTLGNAEPKFKYTYGIELSVEREVRAQASDGDQVVLEAHLDQDTWKFYDLYVTPEGEEYLIENKKG